MATQDIGKFVVKVPGTLATKNYQVELNKETGSTVTYDVTNLGQKDAVLRNDAQVVNGEKIYITQFVPNTNGNLPSGQDAKFLSEVVAKQSDQARSAFYQKNAPKVGKDLSVPGVKNTSNNEQQQLESTEAADITYFDDPNIPAGKTQTENSFGHWAYPKEVRDSEQDFIKFSMIEYAPRKLSAVKVDKRFSDKQKVTLGSVSLPIQPAINDRNTVDWQGEGINPLQIAGARAALVASAGVNAESAAASALKTFETELGGEQENLKQYLRLWAAGKAVGVNLLPRVAGAVVNPNLELLFNGPQLRPFSFAFRLSPRNADEARQVKSIIRFFKQGMAVRKSSENIFLKTPNIFEIQYIFNKDKRDAAHPGLNAIKLCALTSCNVEYTPDGSYATFGDGTMTSYGLNLDFTELEPVYSDDYEDDFKKIDTKGSKANNAIGY